MPVRSLLLNAAAASLLCGACQAHEPGGVRVDGSSSLFPLTEAVGEAFSRAHKSAELAVGISGSGGGFKKLCRGETDIATASRPISSSERALCAARAIAFVELPVALDGVVVVVNPQATWVDSLSLTELSRAWNADAQDHALQWRDLRPTWPASVLRLYGPGTDSATFEVFSLALTQKPRALRGDYSASEDDNLLVQGVAGDPRALGFFSFSYYRANAAALRLVPIDAGRGPVVPSESGIALGQYAPFSRAMFLYVNAHALERAEVMAFVTAYVTQAASLAGEVGLVPLAAPTVQAIAERLTQRRTGSAIKDAVPASLAALDALYRGDAAP